MNFTMSHEQIERLCKDLQDSANIANGNSLDFRLKNNRELGFYYEGKAVAIQECIKTLFTYTSKQ
jgi:hypothetical protein